MSYQSSQHGEGVTPIDTDSETTSRVQEDENNQQQPRSRTCARRGGSLAAVLPAQSNQMRDVLQNMEIAVKICL